MDRRAVAAVAALDDDARSALYAFVRAAESPVTREAAAEAVGISRKLAAFHLEKLVDAGLLVSGIEAVGVPRVGRTPKVYEPASSDLAVHVPPREPEVLAEILVEAVLTERGDERADQAVMRVARERGFAAGATERDRVRPGRIGSERALGLAGSLLEQHGFEPTRADAGLRLRNCPFHPHASKAPGLVCGLNHAFISGLLDGLQAEASVEAILAPTPGACCVRLQPR
ncbi:MAG: helix-turn-helix domain-containing protein [Jatrophihabitantaceae bacterium]